MKGVQVPLALNIQDEATFANFYPGKNVGVLNHLQSFVHPFIYLWGDAGSGRTHLLQACCQALPPGQSLYLDLRDSALTTYIFSGMEYFKQICLDNVEEIAGKVEWELALFHFYNRIQEQSSHLLVASRYAPQALPIELADLRSRFSAGLPLNLLHLSDEEKIIALQMRAQYRGLNFSFESVKFLINHYPRDMHALFNALNVLDQAAWIAKRPLTIPFIKKKLIEEK